MKYIILALSFVVSSCGAQALKPSHSQTELIVEYNGVEVSRTGSKYTGQATIDKLLAEKREFVVIFSTDWCSACKVTRKALSKANLKIDVYYLNIDESWVQKLAYILKLRQVPFMIHVGKDGDSIAQRLGPGRIVSYLLTKF